MWINVLIPGIAVSEAMASLGMAAQPTYSEMPPAPTFAAPAGPRPMARNMGSAPHQQYNAGPGPSPAAASAPAESGGILTALKSFMTQLKQNQDQEVERQRQTELRFEEMLARQSPAEDKTKEMDKKTENIQQANKEAKIDELINILKAKSAEQDTLLKKISEGKTWLTCLSCS